MAKFMDLSGKKFNRLTVISLNKNRSTTKRKYWDCICECGTSKICNGDALKNGHTKSCGCLVKETIKSCWSKRKICKDSGEKAFRHVWKLMMRRCYNTKDSTYVYYGGRGIKVCDRWKVYENFKADMFPRPKGLSLDRIDNNADYKPENCRWASVAQQANNRRSNVFKTINGVTKTVSEWSKDYNINRRVVYSRLRRGWFIEDALLKPVRPHR